MDNASITDHAGVSEPVGSPPTSRGSIAARCFVIVGDALAAALGLAILIAVVTAPAAIASFSGGVVLGAWAGVLGAAVLPGLLILASVPPRRKLRETSALFDRAVAFGKSVWSVTVFIGSLVIGTAVGVGVSATADEESPSLALEALFSDEAQLTILRVLGAVVLVCMLHMVVMWLIDLEGVGLTGEATAVVGTLENRWTGRLRTSKRAGAWRRGIAEAAQVGAKFGLMLLAGTMVVTYGLTLFLWL
ncbi:hypothetical protein IFT90_00700 [Frigoribacterium sp. CFBP 8766]|uniref:hypothetical protein n=1 Tax=Frigoribacterium sp. CFBP 8766 TaxID=2775273 RepID=UPI001780DBF5|nr:hypothetical protein [Frigoribacterium sp. CFBP 8766]MBD8583068.1 hypothetical protein [Frigoribacterium sp. CFBP 8766]